MRRSFTAAGIGLALVLLVGVNMLAQSTLRETRLDLTEHRLYSLAEGTRSILAGLDEPVTLRLFLSRRIASTLPSIAAYTVRVRELLRRYEQLSEGMVRLEIIDPEPFSAEEDRALGYGLQGVPVGGGDERLYFGLVGSGPTDEREVIPFFTFEREPFLEYDLTRMVYQLSRAEQPAVALLSSVPIDGGIGGMMGGARPWAVVEQMRQFLDVTVLGGDVSRIGDDIDVLMVVQPAALEPRVLYAIDQFVMNGGRLLLFADPLAETATPPGAPPAPADLGAAAALLESWGVRLVPGTLAADLTLAVQVQATIDQRTTVLDYPVWMSVGPDMLDPADVVTADVGSLVFATPGILEPTGSGELRVEPLAWTTDQAARIEAELVSGPDRDLRDILRRYRPGGERLSLAVRVTGPATSAFTDGPPDGADAQENGADTNGAPAENGDRVGGDSDGAAPAEHLASSTGDINVIVVADVDLLNDRFWISSRSLLGTPILVPTAGNGSFVVNALENLAGNNDLISVRSRGTSERPFTLVQELRRDAELRYRAKEGELLRELETTERQLAELEQARGDQDRLLLSDAQRREVERFRQRIVEIREELRAVRHQLRQDIERLEALVRFANIGLVPLLVVAAGLLFGLRRRRLQRRAGAGGGGRS